MLHILDHPLAAHTLSILRDKSTTPERFRDATCTISMMLALEATRTLRTTVKEIETPVATAKGYELSEALEATGEVARALAICIELQAEAGNYRDVAARVSRLAKVQ